MNEAVNTKNSENHSIYDYYNHRSEHFLWSNEFCFIDSDVVVFSSWWPNHNQYDSHFIKNFPLDFFHLQLVMRKNHRPQPFASMFLQSVFYFLQITAYQTRIDRGVRERAKTYVKKSTLLNLYSVYLDSNTLRIFPVDGVFGMISNIISSNLLFASLGCSVLSTQHPKLDV